MRTALVWWLPLLVAWAGCGGRASLAPEATGSIDASTPPAVTSGPDGGARLGTARSFDCDDAVRMPRPIAPASFATIATARPLFRWARIDPAKSVDVQVCRDPACGEVVAQLRSDRDEVRPTDALPKGPLFWRLGVGGSWSCVVWPVTLGADAGRDTVVRSRLDVNGDGYEDLVLPSGAELAVWLGGGGGLPREPLLVVTPSAERVWAVAPAGDVDRDGYGDVWVGQDGPPVKKRFSPPEHFGTVTLYRGTADGTLEPWRSIPAPAGAAARGFGDSIVGGADVNGDGTPDAVVIASGGWPPEDGRALLPPREPARAYLVTPPEDRPTQIGPTADPGFPMLVTLGDVNANGMVDVVWIAVPDGAGRTVLALFLDGREDLRSTVHPLRRAASGPPVLIADVDGDGLGDLVYMDSATFSIARGRPGRAPHPAESTAAYHAAHHGRVVDGIDVDRDGCADLVGYASGRAGRGFVIHGSPQGLGTRMEFYAAPVAELNAPALYAGDFDGNGVGDLVFCETKRGAMPVCVPAVAVPREEWN